jgi:8-oxo-dGTP pyrophosphatase MutT (NUDIX family)
MNLRFKSEADFDDFKKELKSKLKSREIRTIEKTNLVPSAVMILIMNRDGEAHVLLTKRTSLVATHKGEVSLPGGKHDDEDGNLADTALRETHEEVGVRPEDIEVLGEFDHYFSLYGFHVSSFVGSIKHPYQYVINADEIEEYMETPLMMFQDLKYDTLEYVEWGGQSIEVYHYTYNNFMIWGLTARVLTDFAQKVLKD